MLVKPQHISVPFSTGNRKPGVLAGKFKESIAFSPCIGCEGCAQSRSSNLSAVTVTSNCGPGACPAGMCRKPLPEGAGV